MLVAASTECFQGLPLTQTIDRIIDLEFVNIEIDIHEDGNHLKPSDVAADLESAIEACRNTHRADVVIAGGGLAGLAAEVPEAAKAGRVDLRNTPLVTIDGEDARDFRARFAFYDQLQHLQFARAESS